MSVSLYVHIPFCLKRCVYCDFVSGIYEPKKAYAYIQALKKEMSNIAAGTLLSTLYIGGGTPSALTAEALSDLIRLMFKHFQFTENYEATLEANPGTVDKEKLQTLRSIGVNRLSIGVQSFSDDELVFLGRIHSSEEAEQAVHLARESGFENTGIDLIYGIPGQSIESWKRTLEKAVSLKPQHISTYELTVEGGTELYEYFKNPPSSPFLKGGDYTPLWTRGARGDFTDNQHLPPEDKIIEMYEYTIDYLTSEGYIHYEISNFARPGFQCRHNLKYWDRGEYYGVGLGAHSFINGERFHNTDNLDDYLRLILENKSPVRETERITDEKALSEAIFLGLRKTEGVNLEAFSEHYGKDIMQLYKKEIEDLKSTGLIEIASNGLNYSLKLTRKGILLSNEVFAKFL